METRFRGVEKLEWKHTISEWTWASMKRKIQAYKISWYQIQKQH